MVVWDLPLTENNSMLRLSSAKEDQVNFATEHYSKRNPETSPLVEKLLLKYTEEGMKMPYTLKDFKNDYINAALSDPEVRQQTIHLFTVKE
jgi:hypothetical protein